MSSLFYPQLDIPAPCQCYGCRYRPNPYRIWTAPNTWVEVDDGYVGRHRKDLKESGGRQADPR